MSQRKLVIIVWVVLVSPFMLPHNLSVAYINKMDFICTLDLPLNFYGASGKLRRFPWPFIKVVASSEIISFSLFSGERQVTLIKITPQSHADVATLSAKTLFNHSGICATKQNPHLSWPQIMSGLLQFERDYIVRKPHRVICGQRTCIWGGHHCY